MLPWRASLFHPLVALLLVTNYFATPGLCADDPGMISFTYPQATNNRFTVGDTIEIAWLSRSPGQHAFNLDLVLSNGTLIGSIASECFCSSSLEPSLRLLQNRGRQDGRSDSGERRRFQLYDPGPVEQQDHPSLQLSTHHPQH